MLHTSQKFSQHKPSSAGILRDPGRPCLMNRSSTQHIFLPALFSRLSMRLSGMDYDPCLDRNISWHRIAFCGLAAVAFSSRAMCSNGPHIKRKRPRPQLLSTAHVTTPITLRSRLHAWHVSHRVCSLEQCYLVRVVNGWGPERSAPLARRSEPYEPRHIILA